VHAGELAEGHGNRVRDEGGDDIAEDHAGTGDFEGGGGAEKQSGADGAADGDHGHLAGSELMVETLFVDDFLGGEGHAARYQIPKILTTGLHRAGQID